MMTNRPPILLALGALLALISALPQAANAEPRRVKATLEQTLTEPPADGWNAISSMALSRDGRWLAAEGREHRVLVWELGKPGPPRAFAGHTASIGDLVFSPDGGTLYSAGTDKRIGVWALAGAAPVRWLEAHRDAVGSLALSADGRLLVSGGTDRRIKLWEVERGVARWDVEAGSNSVRAVALSPDGARFAAVEYSEIVIRALKDGAELIGVRPRSCAFAEESRVLCLKSREVEIEEFGDEGMPPSVSKQRSIPVRVSGIAWSPDGRQLAAAREGGEVVVIDAATGAGVRRLEGHPKEALAVAYSPDGVVLASGDRGGELRLWSAASGRAWQAIPHHKHAITAIAFFPGSDRLATGSMDGTVAIWRLSR